MKIYCSCCDKVQSVRIDNCRDAKTNEPFQDIVCAECDLVIASGTDIAQPEQDTIQRLSALVRAQQITIDKLEAQPEQEPVATLDDLEQEIYENTRQFVSRDVMEWMLKRYYTTPPQREPKPFFTEANGFPQVFVPKDRHKVEQGPVAWMQNTTAGLYVIDHYDEWHCIPLYTTPPQRKPLSDEQTIILKSTTCPEIDWKARHGVEMNNGERNKWMLDWFMAFKVAIEAAHGIKENT